jgi:hypothetical protein
MGDKGVLEEFLPTSFVILCNCMKTDPENFVNAVVPGQGTPLEMACRLA